MAYDTLPYILAVLGGSTVLMGSVSLWTKVNIFVNEPMVATCVGIIAGPKMGGFIDPFKLEDHTFYAVTLEFCAIVIALQLMSTASSLPRFWVWSHWKELILLVGPIMTLEWAVSWALAIPLFEKYGLLELLALAGALTPTDPILSVTIARGRFAEDHLPAPLRQLMEAESGINDGAAFPYVFLPVLLIKHSAGHAIGRWAYYTVLYQVVLGSLVGAVLGYVAAKLFNWARARDLIDRDSSLIYSVAIAITALGAVESFSGNGILAVFFAGIVFADHCDRMEQARQENTLEILDTLAFTIAFFFFGTALPYHLWDEIGIWRLILYAVGIVFLRRLFFILAFKPWLYPAVTDYKEAAYLGFVGPIGVATIFYAALLYEELGSDFYYGVMSFTVLVSLLIHGTLSGYLAKVLRRHLPQNKFVDPQQEASPTLDDTSESMV